MHDANHGAPDRAARSGVVADRCVLVSLWICLYAGVVYQFVTQAHFILPLELKQAIFGNPVDSFARFGPTAPTIVAYLVVGFALFAALPDYLSLAKTRVLIKMLHKRSDTLLIVSFVMADSAIAAALSITFVVVVYLIEIILSLILPEGIATVFRVFLIRACRQLTGRGLPARHFLRFMECQLHQRLIHAPPSTP